MIRVVLVKEEGEWRAYCGTDPEATAAELLEAMADGGALEETFTEVKEVWGAGQQQGRNLQANVACCNLNSWLSSRVEAWSWEQPAEVLVDRRASRWDDGSRRPCQADRRQALPRQVLREEIEAVLQGRPSPEEFRRLAER